MSNFRLVHERPDERVVTYLCPGCETIIKVDLALDEVKSSSCCGSFSELQRRLTVLVADDSEPVLVVADRLLSDAGYRVLVAADGNEALRIIRQEHPDLVLLDVVMPKMNGFQVLREIRRDKRLRRTPVVMMSGIYEDKILRRLYRHGAQGYLPKARIQDTLVFRTRQLLASRPRV